MKLSSLAIAATFFLANNLAKAENFQLEISGNEPLYQTKLPKEVYQYSRSNDLQDLSITNANGEQVPHALIAYKSLHAQTTASTLIKPLPIFPIIESRLNDARELSIQLEKNTVNTSVSINANEKNANEKTIYLIDAGKKHAPLQTLSVDWQNSIGKLLSIDILVSNDLKSWSNAGHAVLLKTSAEDRELLQNRIILNAPTEARYLQLRPDGEATIALTKINAEYNSEHSLTPQALWQEAPLLQREQDEKIGVVNLDFESTGHYPADRLRVYLPQINTITNANIFIRNRNNEPWQWLSSTSLYRTEKSGKNYTNPDILINTTTSRYWRIQFHQTSGGIGQNNPQLSLGWLPQTLVWNARGQAPFTLQVGESPNIINHVSLANLIPDYKIEKVLQLPQASLTIPTGVSNNTHDQAQKSVNTWTSPPDYKRWLLWAGLFLGVLLLAGMVYSLIKSERAE